MMLPFSSFFADQNVESAPEQMYHPGMLLVKSRGATGAMTAGDRDTRGLEGLAGPSAFTRAAAAALPGMGALLNFERSGLIRRLVPLAEAASGALESLAETPALSMMAAAASSAVRDDPNAGVTLVELHNDSDRPALEAQLAADPTIEEYSRVPIRYLLAKRVAAKKAKKAAGKKKAAPAAATPAAMPPTVLWNLAKIRWDEARARTGFKNGSGIKVAVLDTGIDRQHPDLAASIDEYVFAHPSLATASSERDVIGHGTHVAGTIAAQINNNVGINGIAACRIHAYKIFDDRADWSAGDGIFVYFVDPVMYRRALARCVSVGINVVNLSIGGPGAPDFQEQQLFKVLINKGVSVVAAMGNENSLRASYPAAIPGVIAVGATSIDDSRASFSNMGPHIALSAPGVSIWSTLPTYPGNTGYRAKSTFPPTPDMSRPLSREVNYAAWNGTSMATPHVAGAAALLLANKGLQSGASVKRRLQKSAAKVPGMKRQSFTQEFGSGRLDLFQLLK